MLRRHLRQNTRPLFYVAGPSRFVSGMISGIDRHGCGRTGSSQSRAVIIYEDNRTLGIGAEVSAIIAEQAFDCLGAPILRVTAPDVPLLPAANELERYCVISVEKIVAAFEQSISY
jgi:2-oxoisovalerate dehydrogenase E1 component beta subunit